MCLAIPGKVVDIKDGKFLIDYKTEKREASQSIINIKKGDYVIVSNKIITAKVDKKKAEEFLEMLNEQTKLFS